MVDSCEVGEIEKQTVSHVTTSKTYARCLRRVTREK